MKPKDLKAFYSQLQQEQQTAFNKAKTNIFRISSLRLLVFFGGIISIYLLFDANSDYSIFIAFGFLILFLALVKIHSRFFLRKRLIENKLRIAKEELRALEGNYSAFKDGSRYTHRSKAYAFDMDIFGPDSLYQKINRTISMGGAGMLAHWFNFSEQNTDIIKQKQLAVKELSDADELRLNFRAEGLMVEEEKGEYRSLIAWLKEKDLFYGKPIFQVVIWLASVINVSGLFLYFTNLYPASCLGASLFSTLIFVGFWQKKIHKLHMNVGSKVKLLSKYAKLFTLVEQADFQTDYLKDIQKDLGDGKQMVSLKIKHLSKVLSALDTRLNVFAGIVLNAIFLWDIIQVTRLEKWKHENQDQMKTWFTALGKFDALLSLSTMNFNHPQWVMPEISERDFELEAEDLKHPLMADADCVGNDIRLPERPHIKVITGANMAGKSTFLRSLGTNMLLAMMGAPVSAKFFRINPIEIISSIRTKDSLIKNESYFYAEIKRLEVIIRRLQKGDRLFVFLDEILKGTNSKDKELGSKALLKQLVELKAVGVIATHDLNLGVISQDFKSHVENICFEVEIRDGGLHFDYKIRPGIAQNLSATYLMKEMGITL